LITGQEITVGVLDDQDDLMALPILELIPKNRFYDYEAKYTPNMTDFILPATLSDSMTDRCHDLAKTVHQIMGCRGVSRTDMIVSPDFGPMILELNSIPGMTDTSDLPAQARHAGIAFDDLVERILASAL
jgi:D-alanine-D-alanine ligase